MTANDPLQPGQAAIAHDAILRGEVAPVIPGDRITERARLAIEADEWAAQQAWDRRQLGMRSTVTATVSLLAALPGGGAS